MHLLRRSYNLEPLFFSRTNSGKPSSLLLLPSKFHFQIPLPKFTEIVAKRKTLFHGPPSTRIFATYFLAHCSWPRFFSRGAGAPEGEGANADFASDCTSRSRDHRIRVVRDAARSRIVDDDQIGPRTEYENTCARVSLSWLVAATVSRDIRTRRWTASRRVSCPLILLLSRKRLSNGRFCFSLSLSLENGRDVGEK